VELRIGLWLSRDSSALASFCRKTHNMHGNSSLVSDFRCAFFD
jgi:hypothetical protein